VQGLAHAIAAGLCPECRCIHEPDSITSKGVCHRAEAHFRANRQGMGGNLCRRTPTARGRRAVDAVDARRIALSNACPPA
jgi:hypothetical protein